MKEHAIPQDITGYKFHIVGNMTLKQFAEVALGFVVAFFLYKTNLYFPIKWSLIAFSASFGAALAFMPIEERPLDHWFITFFTILYKPTKFYWKREPKVPEVFTYKPDVHARTQVDTVDLSPQRRERITEYLQSVKKVQEIDQEEIYYKQRSDQLLSIFEDQSLKINYDRAKRLKKKPNLKIKVRSLIGVKKVVVTNETQVSPVVEAAVSHKLATSTNTAKLEKQSQEYKPLAKKIVSTEAVAAEITIPEIESIHLDESYTKEQKSMGKATSHENQQLQKSQQEVSYIETTNRESDSNISRTSSVVINKDLPFPTKPSKPNKLVGMTLTQNNELINEATLTLKNENGTPVTAVQSNALGQFFITSQLNNGTYNILVKKTGFTFSPISINLKGETVDPLEIRSNE